MRRLHVPELEDEPWFPPTLRDGLTAFLQVSSEKLRVFGPATPVLRGILDRHHARSGQRRVVDLCSGGGGALLPILETLADTDAILTDRYPNLSAFAAAERRLGPRVRGHSSSIDATDVPAELTGVRTLFNALHHFRPEGARQILSDAARKRQPVCAFEVVARDPVTLITVAAVPLAVLAFIPLTAPDARRLALTYALPIIPAATGWDGIASCMRAYSRAELQELAQDVATSGYGFTVGEAARGFPVPLRVRWIVGEPVEGSEITSARSATSGA